MFSKKMFFKNKSKDNLSVSAVSISYTTVSFIHLLMGDLILPSLLQQQMGKLEAFKVLFQQINPKGVLIFLTLNFTLAVLFAVLYNVFISKKWKFFKQY